MNEKIYAFESIEQNQGKKSNGEKPSPRSCIL